MFGLDGGDAAAGDRDVADRIEPDRRIDDASALDEQVVFRRLRRERLRIARDSRRARDGS